jgi:hypothetical protein
MTPVNKFRIAYKLHDDGVVATVELVRPLPPRIVFAVIRDTHDEAEDEAEEWVWKHSEHDFGSRQVVQPRPRPPSVEECRGNGLLVARGKA